MSELQREISTFLGAKDARLVEARQMAALQIACHLDLRDALSADSPTRARIILRLDRMIERERLRGARNHWSYDLNRHIALKQVVDRLRALDGDRKTSNRSTANAKRRPRRRSTSPDNVKTIEAGF